jgi:hypothetical protein
MASSVSYREEFSPALSADLRVKFSNSPWKAGDGGDRSIHLK